MVGLKSFLRWIATTYGMPFDALYERQRELVRHGLLPVREGRGPGSGVPLTAETLATFVIGLLATDNLNDIGERTSQLCAARPLLVAPSKRSTHRGVTFHSDVAKALIGSTITGYQPGDDLHQNLYFGIQVTRHWRGVLLQNRALIDPDGDAADGLQGVEYIVSEDARLASPMISRTASIEMEAFWFLCTQLRSELGLISPKARKPK